MEFGTFNCGGATTPPSFCLTVPKASANIAAELLRYFAVGELAQTTTTESYVARTPESIVRVAAHLLRVKGEPLRTHDSDVEKWLDMILRAGIIQDRKTLTVMRTRFRAMTDSLKSAHYSSRFGRIKNEGVYHGN